MTNLWYVYILFRRDTGEPFYVGYGKEDRWLFHEEEARLGKSRNPHKMNIIKAIQATGKEVPKIKIAEDLTVSDARALEVLFIAAIGRRPEGPLVNLTKGGDGLVDPSPEVRAKIGAALSGRKLAASTCALMSSSRSGMKHAPEVYKRAGATNRSRGHKRTLETKAKMSARKLGKPNGRKGIPLTDAHKENLRGPRGPQPKMRGPRGHWFLDAEGNEYVAFEPRSPTDKRGRK